jgi:formiminotetrahydrofolate cyclodeaminase
MNASPLLDLTLREFLSATSAKTPTPGGGAVAGVTGALSAALAGMVVSYSVGKKSLAQHDATLREHQRVLERARTLFVTLAEEDAQAYGLVNELSRLPEGDPRRVAEMPGASRASVDVPMSVAALALDLLRDYEKLVAITNPHLRSDLAIAAVLASATARSAWWNVVVNVGNLPASERLEITDRGQQTIAQCDQLAALIERGCAGPAA